ncbi:MAG: serpin family protein, partial [Candidatus Eisenbacteria bacterium]|nr:serpin family protein [Candidatus Eisenbacteria bacterium]
EDFGAGFNTVDFVRDTEKARTRINGWVEDETNDRIENLIPRGALDSSTVLVLVNAIYFKGDWKQKFDEEATREAPFMSPGEATTVDMMHRVDDYGYLADDAAQVLELPYQGGDLAMTVILPTDESDGALAALESSLTPELLADWFAGLSERKVDVSLPRFTIHWGTEELGDDLRALGIVEAFKPGTADFSGIAGNRELFISKVLHKAFVDVNEEGSEAAAATAVGIARTSIPEPPPVFRADRPFLFLIRDRGTGAILFMGRLASP